jgi:FkbM family methyltransferase
MSENVSTENHPNFTFKNHGFSCTSTCNCIIWILQKSLSSTVDKRKMNLSQKRQWKFSLTSILFFLKRNAWFCLLVYWILFRKSSWQSYRSTDPTSFISSMHRTPEFPPKCSKDDYDIIRYQLPAHDCLFNDSPNACSISYATRCPDPFWFREQYRNGESLATPQKINRPIAISVGCNKGTDAVNTLALISGLSRYNVSKWNDVFLDNKKTNPGPCDLLEKPVEEFRSNRAFDNAIVYCIEAMPVTGARLAETANKLGWQDHIIVTTLTIADTDGFALFPNVEDEIGVEYLGLGDCYIDKTRHLCKEVPLARLDTFAAQHVDQNSLIEFLSIDAEGYDFEVLLGATETLRRSKYLEFEYHEDGAWQHHLLSTAIAMLKGMNFVCYWAGSYGHLWRITECWMDLYQSHSWSNVACVNVGLVETEALAARMEEDFQKTLLLGNAIQYAVEYGNPFELHQ